MEDGTYTPSDLAVSVAVDGYAVVPNVFAAPTDSTALHAELGAHWNHYAPLFGKPRQKRCRFQRSMKAKDKILGSIVAEVSQFLARRFPSHEPKSPVVLYSLAGCGVQCAHSDYLPETLDHVGRLRMPIGCLVALEADTTLTVWPNVFATDLLVEHDDTQQTHPVVVDVPAGGICLFRADQVHAGSAYERANFRAHLYMDTASVMHNHDRTWRVDRHTAAARNLVVEI